MRHVDTLSTIYRHIFHSKLPTKSSFVEKKRSKVVLYYLENYLQNYRLWRKDGKNWYYIIQKIIILASHIQCLLQKRTSHRVAGA